MFMSTAPALSRFRPLPTVARRYDRGVPAGPPIQSPAALDHAFAAGAVDLKVVYDAHGSLVYSICRKALDEHAANEVTQDVFLSAWRGKDQFDPDRGTLAGWLVGITKRRIIDHLRSERRHADRRSDEQSEAVDHTAETDVVLAAERIVLLEALRQLPERTREIIELAYVQDLTHQDIAERTGVPLGTVKSDIRRGLLRIRDLMETTNG
jgi:RNA polymerase sigma factor (sigma-70 family)